jgi:hypothetical protein
MPSAMDDPYKAPATLFNDASVVPFGYAKRLAVAWSASFVVVTSYAVALKLASEIDVGELAAITLVAAVMSLLSGAIAALALPKHPVAMVVATQMVSIAMIGAIWLL